MSLLVAMNLVIRLVMAFVSLTLLPSTVLFVFAINFITSSIEFWFNVPVEQALENSLSVGRTIYQRAEVQNGHLLERVAYQIERKNLLDPQKNKALSKYIQIVQKEFNVNVIEVYAPNTQRLAYAVSPVLEDTPLEYISASDLRKASTNGMHTISTQSSYGELLRTIGTVPFNTPPADASAILAISLFIPPGLSASMDSITRGFEEYQQIKLLKRPITSFYYITLSVVALLVVFCAVWFGFYLAKTITIPLMQLAEGTRKVAEGDLSFALNVRGDDEIGSLVSDFNKMTRDLRVGREQLELSAQMLRQQNIEIEERRRYMEIVLKKVSAGVITLDANGTITTFNTAAETMLNMQAEDILGKSFRRLLPEPYLEIAKRIHRTLAESSEEAVELPARISINGRPRSFLAYINPLLSGK